MAIDAKTVWEFQSAGSNTNGGGSVWLWLSDSTTYKWTLSASGTNEYYCEAAAGGNPGLTEANDVYIDMWHNHATNGTVGSLNPDEWDYGDNDTLGYSTVYVRLASGADPDTLVSSTIGMVKYGGYDYSQQTSAQLSITDLASDVAGTGLSSATGGFTALMKGNIIRIESTGGFTAGWYVITAYTDTNNITIDRSAGASMSGGSAKIGGAMALPTDAWSEARVQGNRTYIKSDGTYTLTELIDTTKTGINNDEVSIMGYNTTRGDRPTGTDRPLIDCGTSYYFYQSGDYNVTFDLMFTGSYNGHMAMLNGQYHHSENCKFSNTGSGASASAAYIFGTYGRHSFLEGTCPNASSAAIFWCGSYSQFSYCYAHDSVHTVGTTHAGFNLGGVGAVLFNCISARCGKGVYLQSASTKITNCTIDDCDIGVHLDSNGHLILGTIVSHCASRAIDSELASRYPSTMMQFCNWHGNAEFTDTENVRPGDLDTYDDPVYTDAVNGDYSHTLTNIVGFGTTISGSTTDNNHLQGAWQRAGGGSSETSYGYVG